MYTVKEIAGKMEISEHTMRFWAKSGLFPALKRDKNNIRLFSDTDLEWAKIIKCLRAIGTENKEIKRYIELCLKGDTTIPERFEIIKTTKKKAVEKMAELKKQLELLDYKENLYKELMTSKGKDNCNPVNKGRI